LSGVKAMILCAGRGERMRPLTDTLPKPLLPVGGRPLVEWTVARLAAADVREIVINHAHLGHLLESSLGDGARFGVSIRYSAEGEALETAGGIATALPLLGEAPFIVANGDVWCDFDFARLVRHVDAAAFAPDILAHLVLVANPQHHLRGDFGLAAGRLTTMGESGERFTFSGIGLYRPALFSGTPHGERAKLAPLLVAGAERGAITAELHPGRWEDVGTPERLAALDRSLRA
jgi:MurNAc alpha-1-phosphate uridylyltransferase